MRHSKKREQPDCRCGVPMVHVGTGWACIHCDQGTNVEAHWFLMLTSPDTPAEPTAEE